jgi:hypothetical protein
MKAVGIGSPTTLGKAEMVIPNFVGFRLDKLAF